MASPGRNAAAAERRAIDNPDLVESLDQILFLVSADWSRVYYVSPAYERVTGYSCESLFERSRRRGRELVHPEDRHVRPRNRRSTAPRADPRAGRDGVSHPDGRRRDPLAAQHCHAGQATPEGEVDRLVGLAEDITARKQAEIELKRSDADLAQKGGAAHGRTVADPSRTSSAKSSSASRSRRRLSGRNGGSAGCSRRISSA